ncbi:hypothetical protein BJ742DRAFT_480386 [Cladochytrium replicatum]|nr:hypothetical protein BJ742DRAFT_480386 [Cladochytrium replicatum]
MDGPNDETLLRTQLLGSSGSSVLSPAALNAFLTRHPDFLNSPAYRQLSTLIQSSTITEHAVPALGATATSSAAEPIRRSSLQKTAGMATASRPPVAIDLPISSGAPTMILSDEGDRTAYLQDNVQQPRMTVLPHSAPHSGVLLNSSASLAPQSYHEQLNKQHLMLPPQNLQRALSSQYLQLHQQQQPQPQALTVPMSQMQFVSLGQNQQQTNIQAQLVSVSRPPPLSTVQLPQTQPSTSSQALQLRASSEINTTIQLQLIQSLLQPLEERINQIEKNNQAYYRFTDQLSTRIKQTNSILSELRPSIRQLAGGIGSHPFFDPPFETLAVETREVQVGNLPIVLPQLVTDVCVIDPVSNLSSSVSLKFWYFVTGHLDKQICSRFVSTPNKSLNVGNIQVNISLMLLVGSSSDNCMNNEQMDLEGQSCLEGCPHQSIRPIYAFFGDEQYDYPRQNIQFLFEYRGVNVGRLAYFVEGRGFLVHPALVWLYSKDIGGPIGQSLLDAVLESCTDHKDTLLRVMEDAGFPYWQDHGDSDSPEKAGLNISDSQEINPGGWEKGSSSNSTSKFFVNNDLQNHSNCRCYG